MCEFVEARLDLSTMDIKGKIQSICLEISKSQLPVEDILDLSSLVAQLAEKCATLYATRIFESVVKFVPDEVWTQIFNFLKEELNSWVDLKVVSKQWYSNIRRLNHADFNNSFIRAPTLMNRILSHFPYLVSLKMYWHQDIDFNLLTNLNRLSLKPNNTINPIDSKIHNLSVLTNLTTLSISRNELIDDDVLNSFPVQMKLSLTSLSLKYNNRISNSTLNQFTNLTKLNLKDNCSISAITSLSHLCMLKVTPESLKRLPTYFGYAQITFSDYVYYGEVSKGDMNGIGTCNYDGGDSYHGSFKEGKKHGIGIYKFSCGMTCEGEWICGTIRKKL